jgi:hypothetical protein
MVFIFKPIEKHAIELTYVLTQIQREQNGYRAFRNLKPL